MAVASQPSHSNALVRRFITIITILAVGLMPVSCYAFVVYLLWTSIGGFTLGEVAWLVVDGMSIILPLVIIVGLRRQWSTHALAVLWLAQLLLLGAFFVFHTLVLGLVGVAVGIGGYLWAQYGNPAVRSTPTTE